MDSYVSDGSATRRRRRGFTKRWACARLWRKYQCEQRHQSGPNLLPGAWLVDPHGQHETVHAKFYPHPPGERPSNGGGGIMLLVDVVETQPLGHFNRV